jgi:hypothetical protein
MTGRTLHIPFQLRVEVPVVIKDYGGERGRLFKRGPK